MTKQYFGFSHYYGTHFLNKYSKDLGIVVQLKRQKKKVVSDGRVQILVKKLYFENG